MNRILLLEYHNQSSTVLIFFESLEFLSVREKLGIFNAFLRFVGLIFSMDLDALVKCP